MIFDFLGLVFLPGRRNWNRVLDINSDWIGVNLARGVGLPAGTIFLKKCFIPPFNSRGHFWADGLFIGNSIRFNSFNLVAVSLTFLFFLSFKFGLFSLASQLIGFFNKFAVRVEDKATSSLGLSPS